MAGEFADIVIVGGGGMGSAAAYFLRKMGPPDLSVCVIEADPTYARAATALAAGGVRQQFSTAENIIMSKFGFDFLSAAEEELAIDGDRPSLGLRQVPYLRLAGAGQVDQLGESFELQQRLACQSQWLTQGDLAAKYDWMNVEDVEAAILGGPREGLFDPYAMLQALRKKALSLGADYRKGRVVGFDFTPDGQVQAVRLEDGDEIACGLVLNAAGPQAGHVARLADIDLPVIPIKAHTFVFKCQAPPAELPIVVDQIQLLNVRAEADMFLAGTPREGGLKDAGEDFEIDYTLFDEVVWPMLAHRARPFEAIKMANAWVGHMEWSRLDANPFIGPHPQRRNFYFLTGFSGHGAQHVPAAGRALAELVVHGGFQTIDLSRFGYHRVEAGEAVPEAY